MKSILIKSQQIELNPTKRKKKLKQQNFVISLLLQRLPHIVNTIKNSVSEIGDNQWLFLFIEEQHLFFSL